MENTGVSKHFLDTTIVRSQLHGTTRTREYFKAEFGDSPLYISDYVLMEYRRGYLSYVISFYSALSFPTYNTVADVIKVFGQSFSSREVKAVLTLVTELLSTQRIDLDKPSHKEKASSAVAVYIRRIESKLRRSFKKTGVDSARCQRAKIDFNLNSNTFAEDVRKFISDFDDTKTCRSKCNIDHFFLQKYRREIGKYIEQTPTIKKSANKGFHDVIDRVNNLNQKGSESFNCNECSKIGDAVIALDAPRTMRLEHTDRSFNALCDLIDQPHKLHPSEKSLHKDNS